MRFPAREELQEAMPAGSEGPTRFNARASVHRAALQVVGVGAHVGVDNKAGKSPVSHGIDHVLHDAQNVEPVQHAASALQSERREAAAPAWCWPGLLPCCRGYLILRSARSVIWGIPHDAAVLLA